MSSVNGCSAHIDAVHIFKTPDGDIYLNPRQHEVAHQRNYHRCSPTDLIKYSINVLLKRDPVLRHKTVQSTDDLAAAFSEDMLCDMPNGPNSITYGQFVSWINFQLDELNNASAIRRPAIHYHPLSKVLKVHSLTRSNPHSEVAFQNAGFICNRAAPSTPPIFNIEQHLWPFRQVSMDWITSKEGYFALATNILYEYTALKNPNTTSPPAAPPNFLSCTAFADYFIGPMPYDGGHIPLQEIDDWLAIQDEECLDEREWPLRSEHNAPYSNDYSDL